MSPENNSGKQTGAARAFGVAWSIPFSLVVPMVVAGGLGYLLDGWLHTKPLFLLVLGLAGLGIGIREVMRQAALLDKPDGK